jgi:hypothetical protein
MEERLILRFLTLNYPIKRIKRKGIKRFQRTITISDGNISYYHISQNTDKIKAYQLIKDNIHLVFGIYTSDFDKLLKAYLNI